MKENNDLKNGKIKISNEIFIKIANIAAKEIEGVDSVSKKDTKVELKKESLFIHVEVNIKYGAEIMKTTEKIQEKIKKEIELMTGLKVSNVDVVVLDLKN